MTNPRSPQPKPRPNSTPPLRAPRPQPGSTSGNPPTRRTPTRSAATPPPKPPRTLWRRIRPWLIFVPVLPIVAVLLLYSSVVYGFTPPGQLMQGSEGMEILDREGKPLFTFGDEPGSGQTVSLENISPNLINATVATEDHNFWKNPGGLSITGLARAAYDNLAFWDGGFLNGRGGSSITQQLAKNLYIPPEDRYERSPMRKLKEALYAFELNRRYSKQQILEWYLSNVYYGNGAYGVDSAAHRYFNKAPIDLTLEEATLLAGLPQAPNYYDPLANYEGAIERQKQVLGLMARHKFLTAEQSKAAQATPPAIREGTDPDNAAKTASLAPHFAAYVRELLPTLVEKNRLNGRVKVTTTIDSSLQAKAESTVKTQLDRFEKSYGATNGALVAMDPKTGEVLALVGSHDFSREDISGQVNNAVALNEPGSTMKPVTYMAAMLKGWAPSTMVMDEPMKVANGESSYTLGNADGKYRGNVSVRTALGSSLNVPAVKAIDYASLEQVYALSKKMGVSSLQGISNYGPAFTLGGVDVNLLDMTYVYSVFAANGEQSGMPTVLDGGSGGRSLDPIAVTKIETADGKLIWRAKAQKERIVPAAATYLITNVLSDDSARASMFGTGSSLNLSGRPAAVKTGSSDETRDLWAIGYTPSLVTGVWVGNANNKPMTGTSSLVAAPIWNAFMTSALQGKTAEQFNVPDGIEFANVCATTGQAPTNSCPRTVREPFFAGRLPSGVRAVSNATSTPQRQQPATATPRRQEEPPTPIPTRGLPTQEPQRQPSATPTARPFGEIGQPSPTPRRGNDNGNGNGNNGNGNGNNGNNRNPTPIPQNPFAPPTATPGPGGGLLPPAPPTPQGPGAGLASTPQSGR